MSFADDDQPRITNFEPGRYLTKVGSADYLEVKWRLVWLRNNHPDAHLDTELIAHTDQMALFKATISIPGGGSATGFGSEGYNDFREYIEKAETKAIGRALAALGFGTQFCPDFDFGSSAGVVDSPIDFASTRGRRMNNENDRSGSTGPQNATPRQIQFIQSIARDRGMDDAQLSAEVQELYGRSVDQLDRKDASAFIERLQSRRNMTGTSAGK